MKKIVSFVLALALTAGLTVSATPADTNCDSICYLDGDTHLGWAESVVASLDDDLGETEVDPVTHQGTSTATVTTTPTDTTYKITYNLDGGTNHKDNPATYTAESDDITLKPPTKEGYTFLGWTEDGRTESGTGLEISDDDYGDVDPATHQGTSTATVTTTTPSKTVTIKKGSTGNRTFTAVWEKETTSTTTPTTTTKMTYIITYVLDGGTNHKDNPATYTAESEDITLKDPTKEGYTFLGWTEGGSSSLDDDLGETEVDPVTHQGTSTATVTTTTPSKNVVIKKGSTGNRTFTAVWEKNTPQSTTPTTTTKTEQSITLNRSSLDLEQGDSGTLTATVKPAASVAWSSSNPRIVTVDGNGRYFAMDVGTATITATAGGKTASCRVYVSEPYVLNRAPDNLPTNSRSKTRPTEQKQPTTAQVPAAPTMRTVNNADGTKLTIMNYSDGSLSNVKTDNYGQVLAETVTYSDSAAASNGTLTIPAAVRPAKNSNSAPEIRLVLPSEASAKKHTVRIPVENPTSTTVAVIQNSFGEDVVAVSSSVQNGYLEVDLDGSAVVKVVDNARWFYDVSDANWFANAVAWASSRGVMNGVSKHMFDPNTKTNRAMMAQILYNLSGTNNTAVSSQFSDVSASDWFGKSVTWAVQNGIARSSGNYFGATDDLTREDMVLMLYNFARWKGYDTSARGNLSGFGDSVTVSDWARDAMSWAVGTGLITGTQNGTRAVVLDPQGTATRAQIATLMQRYCGMFA